MSIQQGILVVCVVGALVFSFMVFMSHFSENMVYVLQSKRIKLPSRVKNCADNES